MKNVRRCRCDLLRILGRVFHRTIGGRVFHRNNDSPALLVDDHRHVRRAAVRARRLLADAPVTRDADLRRDVRRRLGPTLATPLLLARATRTTACNVALRIVSMPRRAALTACCSAMRLPRVALPEALSSSLRLPVRLTLWIARLAAVRTPLRVALRTAMAFARSRLTVWRALCCLLRLRIAI